MNFNKKNNISTMLYTINHNKRTDIINNDNLNKYNQNDFLVYNETFIDNNMINKEDFDLKKQTNIRKNKIEANTNDDDLRKNETGDKNIKTILSCSNNLETKNIIRTNIDDGLKELIIKKTENNIDLKSKNNKNNCIII